MSWFSRLVNGDDESRYSLDEYIQDAFTFNGISYPYTSGGTLTGDKEEIGSDFAGVVSGAYKGNGIILACVNARMRLFSQARFQFRRMQSGRPGELFGTQALAPLERPWVNATTSDLLKRMVQDADLAGNFYAHRPGRVQNVSPRARRSGEPVIRRLRPDWMTIVLGSKMDPKGDPSQALDAEVVAYLFHPGGSAANREPIVLAPEEVAHFAPIPDPMAHFRGMSWLSSIIQEILGDKAATTHKLRYLENGATPNLIVTAHPGLEKNQSAFDVWVAKMGQKIPGLANAYKTLYLAHGSDAKVLGSNLKEVDFKIVQGAGETRMAAAAGIPPIIAGFSEGLQAATYSNYGQARRAFADLAARPWWQDAAGSLATLIDVPAPDRTGTTELWYDDRDIPFLAEDVMDAAVAQQVTASTISSLLDAGFDADAVVDAAIAGDLKRLKGKHSGLFSVQLQPPGTMMPPKDKKPVGGPVGGSQKPSDDTKAGRLLRALLDK